MAKYFQGLIDEDGNDAVAVDKGLQLGLVKWADDRSSDPPTYEVYLLRLPATVITWNARVKSSFTDDDDAVNYFFSMCDALGMITMFDPENFYKYRPRYD